MTEEQLEAMPPSAIFQGVVSEMLKGGFGQVSPEVVGKVVEYYNNNYEVNPLADFAADCIFHVPSLEFVNAISSGGGGERGKVYLLRFDEYPEFMVGPYKGTTHGLDLSYLFDVRHDEVKQILDYKIDESKWSSADTDLKNKYSDLVSSFVKTGKPEVPKGASGKAPPTWPPYDPVKGQYLAFSSAPSLAQHLKADRLRLFQQQIPEWIREFPLQPPSKDEL
ncbi:uncharacterized protein LOC101863666 [Aplysia californica]|uniref:Uncharacterized protein LOC101863666 n=1 Tax=Aplysia californica TaxID=6500 RepID=A0ABM0ZZ64_APLCA|nr:uncharacterized protein LOC101863666 [Aplysia californica]